MALISGDLENANEQPIVGASFKIVCIQGVSGGTQQLAPHSEYIEHIANDGTYSFELRTGSYDIYIKIPSEIQKKKGVVCNNDSCTAVEQYKEDGDFDENDDDVRPGWWKELRRHHGPEVGGQDHDQHRHHAHRAEPGRDQEP